MINSNSKSNSLVAFFTLTFLLSVPFYILSALAYLNVLGRPDMGPLYIGLFTITPIASASILAYRSNGSQGLKELLRRTFDFKKISKRKWYMVIVLLPFLLYILSLLCIELLGFPVPPALTTVLALPALIPIFFLLAAGEEVGWMGYSFESMESRLGAVRAALVLGVIWGLWHVPFFIFIMPDPVVLTSQFFTLVATRVLVVWIFNNTGKSVFAAILFHALGNVALMTFPEINAIIPWGSAVYCILVIIASIIVMFLWDSQSLAQYRFTSN